MKKTRERVKNKAILTFLLAFVAIMAAGIFGWVSVQQILTKVDKLSVQDKSSTLINSIFADLIELEQSGRSAVTKGPDSLTTSYHESVSRLKERLDTLKNHVSASALSLKTIDSVYLLLNQLEGGYGQLIAAQRQYGMSALSIKLMQEISKELRDTTRNNKADTFYIVKNNTSFTHASEFTLRTLDSLNRLEVDPERRNIFKKLKRLFGKKKDRPLDTVFVVPDKQIDSLMISSVDSVSVMNNARLVEELRTLVNDFYAREKSSLDQLAELEAEISKKNAELMETIESLILLVDREEIKRTRQSVAEAHQASVGFRKVLLFIIGFFVTTGLTMLYFLTKDLRRSGYYEQQILLEKERSERAVSLKQQFLATMSHEIRSPLTSIVGYAELIDESSEYAQAIKSSSKHLLQTANEILDMAKLESGIIEIHPLPVGLNKFFHEIDLAFREVARKKPLLFECDFSNLADTWVETDPHRLNQVLYNLLDNAFKFTEKGAVSLTASAAVNSENENFVKVQVEIKDSGIGIKPEDQVRIFEDYQQSGTPAYRLKGIGLGLSIVKKLVSILNGHISLKSAPGEGSAFIVTFDFPATSSLEAAVVEKSPVDALSGHRVLVVDDDPLIVNLFKVILEKHGAHVKGAHDAFETLAIIEKDSFDIFIIDLQMPEMNGEELARIIRQTYGDSVKVLLSTANLFLEKDGLELFDEVIIKPFSELRLLQAVYRATGNDHVSHNDTEAGGNHGNSHTSNGYDIELIKRFAMNDPESTKDLVLQFYSETSEDLIQIREKLAGGEIPKLAMVMHKLASRYGQFGVHKLSGIAAEMEKELSQGHSNEYRLASFIAQSKIINEKLKADFGI